MEKPPAKGRPPIPPERRKKRHTISLTDKEWGRLEALAQDNGQNVSELIIHRLKL